MPIGLAIAAIGAATAVAGTAYTLSGSGQPKVPNLASSSGELANAQAQMLPIQRGFEAAAQSGGAYTFKLPAGTDPKSLGLTGQAQGWYDGSGKLVSADKGHFGTTTGHDGATVPAKPPKGVKWKDGVPGSLGAGKVPIVANADGTYTIDFKGYGQADIQSALADASAKSQLALSQKYDSQFIAQALKQEQEADPESFAARQRESELIQQQINQPIGHPTADMLNAQVQSELDAAKAGTLDPKMREILMQAGAQAQADRGGASGSNAADFENPLVTGAAGTARQMAAIGKSTGWLGSGETPGDIDYRREQQNLANLSAEVSGKTPQSQFRTLSGAQQGPTPTVKGPALPTSQNNLAAGQSAAIQNANTYNSAAASQANPWMAGISALLSLGNAGVKFSGAK